MSVEDLRGTMKDVLSKSRYLHVISTEEVSVDLALIHGCDVQKASIAGVLHDCAKYLSNAELIEECKKYNLPITEAEEKSSQLLHAKVGAAYAEHIYNITDKEILTAITYHTTGRPNMTLLEKITFTADYIEPNRKILPRIDEVRKAAYDNLDYAIYLILENTLDYLKVTNTVMDDKTEMTYEYYKGIIKTI
ncbi:MAG: HD domain-containing protein [Clostridiales bacterium]|nr:HD domain-containing protein [Clostridiales bacterium]